MTHRRSTRGSSRRSSGRAKPSEAIQLPPPPDFGEPLDIMPSAIGGAPASTQPSSRRRRRTRSASEKPAELAGSRRAENSAKPAEAGKLAESARSEKAGKPAGSDKPEKPRPSKRSRTRRSRAGGKTTQPSESGVSPERVPQKPLPQEPAPPQSVPPQPVPQESKPSKRKAAESGGKQTRRRRARRSTEAPLPEPVELEALPPLLGEVEEADAPTVRSGRRVTEAPQAVISVAAPAREARREMVITTDPFETRVAVLEDSQAVEITVERKAHPSLVGNIYVAVVKDVLPGMQAAFVDIGTGRNAFLHVGEVLPEDESGDGRHSHRIEYHLARGQEIMVQVAKDPMGGKGPRVTGLVSLPGRYVVLMPFAKLVGISRRLPDEERERLRGILADLRTRGTGMIVRTAAAGASAEEIAGDLQYLKRVWTTIRRRARTAPAPALVYEEAGLAIREVRDNVDDSFVGITTDDADSYKQLTKFLQSSSPSLARRVKLYQGLQPLFEKHGVDKAIEAALRRRVWLRSGGYISIDKTEALTAIDVNTGKFVGKKSLEDTIFKTNREAAGEIVRQLRLRDIGGIIVVDFIDMASQSNREEVFRVFLEALGADKTKARVIEISRLGMLEMTRKKTSRGLLETLSTTCPECEGMGVRPSVETATAHAFREMVRLAHERPSEALLFGVNAEVEASLTGDAAFWRKAQKKIPKKAYAIADPECRLMDVRVLEEGRARQVQSARRRLLHKHQPS